MFVLQSLSTLQDLSHEERQIPEPFAPPGPTGPAALLLLLPLEHPPDHATATPTANASTTPLEKVENVIVVKTPQYRRPTSRSPSTEPAPSVRTLYPVRLPSIRELYSAVQISKLMLFGFSELLPHGANFSPSATRTSCS
jgi:hypothetical protein